jgi:hypothetical protein
MGFFPLCKTFRYCSEESEYPIKTSGLGYGPCLCLYSAYIQAYGVAGKVIGAKGDNTFLGCGGDGIHTQVRHNFVHSQNGGLVTKDNNHISAPSV